MGFFDKIKIRPKKKEDNTTLNQNTGLTGAMGQRTIFPSFSQFGEEITNDDTVLTILNRILDEFSKLNPRHIRTINGRQAKVRDNQINNLLKNPNPYMTKSDFLRKIAFLRWTYDNVFIYPTYDLYINPETGREKKVYTGLYPLQPVHVDFLQTEDGTLYVDFQLINGEHSGAILYDDVIHWRKDYGINDYLGGDDNGNPNNSALLKNLQLNDKLWQSTFKVVEGSLTINGILKYGTLIDKEEREEARLEFVEKLKNNETGILALDTGVDYIPIASNGKVVDKDTLELLEKKIRQHFGVSEAILNGDYTNEQKEAFYESVIEAAAISLGEAFDRVMLTPFERSNGNAIICYTNRVQMMSADKKIKLAELLMPVGGVTANRVLSWFGEPPIEGGDELMMSLNWIKKSIADEYQLEAYKNKKSNNVLNDNNEE